MTNTKDEALYASQTEWYRFAKAEKRVSFIQLSRFRDRLSHEVLVTECCN